MMRNLVLVVLFILGITIVNGQEKNKFRMGLDLGYAFASGKEGGFGSLEAKYNLTNNSNIGLRLGWSTFEVSSNFGADLDEIRSSNYLATYDYYFHKEASSLTTFLGAGLGVYRLTAYQEAAFFFIRGVEEVAAVSNFGVLIRGGIELGKFRLALEYNIVPKTDFEGGEIKNSYLGASLGFYVGGGKWKLN